MLSLPWCSHRDELFQDGGIEAAPMKLRCITASSTSTFSKNALISKSSSTSLSASALNCCPLFPMYSCSFSMSTLNCSKPIGQLARGFPRLRQFVFRTQQLLGFLPSLDRFSNSSRNSRNSVSFVHWPWYANVCSSPITRGRRNRSTAPISRGHCLHVFFHATALECRRCISDTWLLTTRWVRNRSGNITPSCHR